MSNLVIYTENKQSLSEVAFVKDAQDQVKIRDIDNSYERSKRLGLIFVVIANHLGISDAIEPHTKTDVTDMILNRFKNLSLDEVAYAFKLERHGVLGQRTEHYQLFNAEFVGDVLEKFIEWKRNIKIKFNISYALQEYKMPNQEKKYWINSGVLDCLAHYRETRLIKEGKLYVYGVLFDLDYLPKDKDYKDKVKLDAIQCIRVEQEIKKTKTSGQAKSKREILKKIMLPKDGMVINKCKELELMKFFRELIKDEVRLEKFIQTFKIQDNGRKKEL